MLKDGAAVYTPGLSERRGTTSKFYHGDALGSTRGITNSSQAFTDTVLYDGFGMTVSRTGTTPTPFGFVGKGQYQTDSDSGLMLLGHRYYDASVGRFISSDPAQAGDNWYAYCDNNPLTETDSQGLNGWLDDIGDALNKPLNGWEKGIVAGGTIIGGIDGMIQGGALGGTGGFFGGGGVGAIPGTAAGAAGGAGVGALAGRAAGGIAIGTLCIIDTVPRSLSPLEVKTLSILGQQVQAQLDLRYERKRLQKVLAENRRLLDALETPTSGVAINAQLLTN